MSCPQLRRSCHRPPAYFLPGSRCAASSPSLRWGSANGFSPSAPALAALRIPNIEPAPAGFPPPHHHSKLTRGSPPTPPSDTSPALHSRLRDSPSLPGRPVLRRAPHKNLHAQKLCAPRHQSPVPPAPFV